MFAAPHVPDLQGVVSPLPAGVSGVRQTLALMRRLVRQFRTDIDLLQTARSIIFLTPAKDQFAEVNALFEFVRDTIRYTRDIHEVETVSTPDKTLATRVGDCDDKTVLLATLLECVGYPTRFVVAGYNDPSDLEHVYLQGFANGMWVDMDATESEPLGWFPPDPVVLLIEGA